MSDLLQVLAGFKTSSFSHILPSIDKAGITTSDLICLSPQEIAKRAQVPPVEAAKLSQAVIEALQADNARSARTLDFDDGPKKISTLNEGLDSALGGGIPPGYLTEITGERYVTTTMESGVAFAIE